MVPTHMWTCQTWVYPVNCRYCGAAIYVFQCTCGSAVLFDSLGGSWPKHQCFGLGGAGGIGGSGYSGWTAIDVLRSQGVAITREVTEKVFGTRKIAKSTAPADTKKVAPRPGKSSIIGIVREILTSTKNLTLLDDLGDIGRALLGVGNLGKPAQMTVVLTNSSPNESLTFVLPLRRLDKSVAIGNYVMPHLTAKIAGKHSLWVADELDAL